VLPWLRQTRRAPLAFHDHESAFRACLAPDLDDSVVVNLQYMAMADRRTPVGFTKDEATKTLRRNKDAEAVREVFLGRARGRSWNKLAEDLEAAGVKTATGKDRWHTNSVRSLVQNPIYKGILVNGHEHFFSEYAIVTGEEWEAAQEKKAGAPRRDYGSWALLSGLVFCEGCGHRMAPTRDARGFSYYRCQYRACPEKARAVAEELEGLVV
jgi:Recombinase/Recombinase zinc beta ribbon domain